MRARPPVTEHVASKQEAFHADVVEEVNKSGAFVHKGQTQPAEVLLDAVQGFDEVLKSPHAGIERCSTLFKPSDVDGTHQP